jgi:tripeptide aminopeptidase
LDLSVDAEPAIALLLRFLSVEGITGQEEAIGREVIRALTEAGVPRRAIGFDRAHERIPLPTQTGNLIVRLSGTISGPTRLFVTHLDTVPLCAGARPVRKDNRILPAGKTGLGGDNRTGVAVLVNLAATLVQRRLPHPPLTFLFTVREESGLWGAHFVDPADLGHPTAGFNFDGRSATEVTIGAVGAERWEAEIHGKAAHAGVHPEQGVSATLVAALALAEVYEGGWFGKVLREGHEGTSNVGSFSGPEGKSAGVATNVVNDYVLMQGESRSQDLRFARTITTAYRKALRRAAGRVRDHRGRGARVRFQSRLDYYPFRLNAVAPVVLFAQAAAKRAGRPALPRMAKGGLDANWLVRHGIPTVTFGAGQNNIHTTDEFVDLTEFVAGCRLALELATG